MPGVRTLFLLFCCIPATFILIARENYWWAGMTDMRELSPVYVARRGREKCDAASWRGKQLWAVDPWSHMYWPNDGQSDSEGEISELARSIPPPPVLRVYRFHAFEYYGAICFFKLSMVTQETELTSFVYSTSSNGPGQEGLPQHLQEEGQEEG